MFWLCVSFPFAVCFSFFFFFSHSRIWNSHCLEKWRERKKQSVWIRKHCGIFQINLWKKRFFHYFLLFLLKIKKKERPDQLFSWFQNRFVLGRDLCCLHFVALVLFCSFIIVLCLFVCLFGTFGIDVGSSFGILHIEKNVLSFIENAFKSIYLFHLNST